MSLRHNLATTSKINVSPRRRTSRRPGDLSKNAHSRHTNRQMHTPDQSTVKHPPKKQTRTTLVRCRYGLCGDSTISVSCALRMHQRGVGSCFSFFCLKILSSQTPTPIMSRQNKKAHNLTKVEFPWVYIRNNLKQQVVVWGDMTEDQFP